VRGSRDDGQVKFNKNMSKEMTSEPNLTCQIQLRIARSCTTEALRTAALFILALIGRLKKPKEGLVAPAVYEVFLSHKSASRWVVGRRSKKGEGGRQEREGDVLSMALGVSLIRRT